MALDDCKPQQRPSAQTPAAPAHNPPQPHPEAMPGARRPAPVLGFVGLQALLLCLLVQMPGLANARPTQFEVTSLPGWGGRWLAARTAASAPPARRRAASGRCSSTTSSWSPSATRRTTPCALSAPTCGPAAATPRCRLTAPAALALRHHAAG